MRAHANDRQADRFRATPGREEWGRTWAHQQPARDQNRRCWYCGSIHPEDLLAALRAGATLDSADWKYGWPHKFYVHGIPNELAGRTVRVGSHSGPVRDWSGRLNIPDPTPEELASGRFNREIMGAAPRDAVVKFYSEHLLDAGDIFEALRDEIFKQTRIHFKIEGDKLLFRRVGREGAPAQC